MNKKSRMLSASQEGLVVQLLSEAKDLLVLIANNFASKESYYLLQSFFLVLRQMGYFFTEKSSPLISYGSNLTQAEKDILSRIKDIRDAIGHRESPKNFLTANIKLVGGMIFKSNDVEIQYGKSKLYLIGEVITIHKKLRQVFSSTTELSFLKRGYGWAINENELQEAETHLREKLKDPENLVGLKSGM